MDTLRQQGASVLALLGDAASIGKASSRPPSLNPAIGRGIDMMG